MGSIRKTLVSAVCWGVALSFSGGAVLSSETAPSVANASSETKSSETPENQTVASNEESTENVVEDSDESDGDDEAAEGEEEEDDPDLASDDDEDAEDSDEPAYSTLDVKITGALDVGTRIFPKGPQFAGQTNDQVLPYLGGWGRAHVGWNNGNSRLVFKPYGRYDITTDRDLIDFAEAHYFHRTDKWSVLFGVDTVFWGVTESRHLVNIVNQIDLTGDVDEEDRLGQPMVNFNFLGGDKGTLSLFGLFGFREQNFPETIDRLRLALPVVESLATFNERGLSREFAFAARYLNTYDLGFGSADLAVSYFNGMSRTPLLRPIATPGGPAFAPHYDRIHRGGVELVVTDGDMQYKFEGLYARQFGDDVFALVAGFEYTFDDAMGSGIDVGILAEYLFDSRGSGQPPVVGDNDIFGGVRVAFNNDLSTALLAGVTYDHETDEVFGSIEVSSRLTDDLSISGEARIFYGIPSGLPAAAFNREDFINVKLTKYF